MLSSTAERYTAKAHQPARYKLLIMRKNYGVDPYTYMLCLLLRYLSTVWQLCR